MDIRIRRVSIVYLLLAVSCLSLVITGQTGQGGLTGEIADEGGSGIAGAIVRVRRSLTGEELSTKSGASGDFTFVNLQPGEYTVLAAAPGFRRTTRDGVRLVTGERIRLDLVLRVGRVEDEVIVRADASLLRSESGSLGQVIPNRMIANLPLNGRNFFTLITLAPGVAAPPPTSSGPSLPRLNGGRPRVNEFLYDGISALQPEPGQVALTPTIDSIEEFKVETNALSAEFGRFNGGVINLSTRSGTNELHGAIFEYLRNEALNARNLFATTGSGKPRFRRNQYGVAVGGPIRRDRTFLFGDYQGTQQSIGRILVSTVPTSAERRGDFSSSLGAPLWLRETTENGLATVSATVTDTGRPIEVIDTNGRTIQARIGQIFRLSDRRAYAGNIIPIYDHDPAAHQLLTRYPTASESGKANNYRRTADETTLQDQFNGRIDHQISSFSRIFGRLSYAQERATPVTPLPDGSGTITQGVLGDQRNRGLQIVGNHRSTLSETGVNELRVGYTRRSIDRRSVRLDSSVAERPAIPGLPGTGEFGNVMPTITISGLQQLGPTTNTNSVFRTDVTEIFDSLSWQRNRQVLKIGGNLRIERLDIMQPPSPSGVFSFTAPFSNSRGTANLLGILPGNVTTGSILAGQSGNALASLLLGAVGSFSIDLQSKRLRPRAGIAEFFIQDDIRLHSRITLNAGLRYTLNFPSTEADDQGAIFNLETQQLDYAGQNGSPRTARNLEKLNFAPRLGLAWRIGERGVVRLGYGLVWQEQAGITTPFTLPQFPFIQTVTQRSLDGVAPAFILSKGPKIEKLPFDGNAGLGQGVYSVDRDMGSGYAQQWNLAIQRELTKSVVVEVAYAGSKITHVGIPDSNINQLAAGQLALGNALLQQVPNPYFGLIPRSSSIGDPTIPRAQLLRPFPRFTTVSLYRNNVGNTSYHALQAKLEQRLAKGISYLLGYTLSKLIDDAGSVFDAAIQTGPVANFPVADSFNRALERDVSTGDIPNVFVASFTADLPFGRGRLLGDWRLTGTVWLQSGLPFPVTQVTNFNAFAGFGVQRPNLIRNPTLAPGERSTERWFDTSAFAIAPQFALGTASRNPVRGPGYRTADMALIKNFPIGESSRLEFRTEVFNLTNTPPLGNPNGVAGNPAFGKISSAGDPRVIQFGLRISF